MVVESKLNYFLSAPYPCLKRLLDEQPTYVGFADSSESGTKLGEGRTSQCTYAGNRILKVLDLSSYSTSYIAEDCHLSSLFRGN